MNPSILCCKNKNNYSLDSSEEFPMQRVNYPVIPNTVTSTRLPTVMHISTVPWIQRPIHPVQQPSVQQTPVQQSSLPLSFNINTESSNIRPDAYSINHSPQSSEQSTEAHIDLQVPNKSVPASLFTLKPENRNKDHGDLIDRCWIKHGRRTNQGRRTVISETVLPAPSIGEPYQQYYHHKVILVEQIYKLSTGTHFWRSYIEYEYTLKTRDQSQIEHQLYIYSCCLN